MKVKVGVDQEGMLQAIYDAIGVRFTELPVTPEKFLAALKVNSDLKKAKVPEAADPRHSG